MTELLITSSVLILVIVALRTLLKGKIGLRLQYALWLLVALRLLIPVSLFPSPVSVMNAVAPVQSAILATVPRAPAVGQPQGPSTVSPGGTDSNAAPAAPVAPTPPVAKPLDLAKVLPILWLAGAATVAAWFFVSDWIFRRRLRRSARLMKGIHCHLSVYLTEAVPSPCLYGLFRPAVYLTPDCVEDASGLRHVLAHEETHYRHGDQFWSLVRCLCLALYWFHPLVWLAAALSRRDCELACDEGAIKALGEGERIPYGRTLLSMVVPKSGPADLLRTATTMTSGKGGLKERVALIAKKPKAAVAGLIAVVLIVGVAVSCTFTGAETSKTPDLPLAEALLVLPDDLKDSVVLTAAEELPENTLLDIYFAEDYDTNYGGWMFSVARLTPAGFEQSRGSYEIGGVSYLGRDADWYYVMYSPTDVRTAHYETYGPAVEAAQKWVEETLAAHAGLTPLADDPAYRALASDCTFAGAHINVLYKPYYGQTNYGVAKTDGVYTFLLSQPAKQGEGGIWCVDRWYDVNGTAYYNIPVTDVTLAEYYADLQAKADKGEADGAKDPTQVCITFAREHLGHERPAEAFTVGEVYEGEPRIESTAVTVNEGVQKRLETILGGEEGVVTLSVETGGQTKELTVSAQRANASMPSEFTTFYDWTDQNEKAYFNDWDLTPESYDYALTVYDGSKERYFKFFSGSSVVFYHDSESGNNWLEAVPVNGDDGDVAALFRVWFDSMEFDGAAATR